MSNIIRKILNITVKSYKNVLFNISCKINLSFQFSFNQFHNYAPKILDFRNISFYKFGNNHKYGYLRGMANTKHFK